MNLSLYIAKRYTLARSKNTAINIISLFASISIVIGTLALFVVLSVFSGLREYSFQYINKIDPDLKLSAKTGKTFMVDSTTLNKLKSIKQIDQLSQVIEQKVLFKYTDKEQVATLKGIDSLYKNVNTLDNTILASNNWLKPQTKQAVIGSGIANKLAVGIYDYKHVLEVYAAKPGKGLINRIEDGFTNTYLVPVDLININEEFDNQYVFCDISTARKLLNYNKTQITHLEIKLTNDAQEKNVINQINTLFNHSLVIKNRIQLNDVLYKMFNTENAVAYLIFTLILIVALFNLIGTLIMMIIEKKENFITLFNLGMSLSSIKKIILYQGIIISITGGLLGVFLGYLLVLIQKYFGLIKLQPTIAYPVKIEFNNFLIVFITIASLGLIASLIASSRITKTNLKINV